MKKIISFVLCIGMFLVIGAHSFATDEIKNEAEYEFEGLPQIEVNVKSAVLMEASTGKILYSQNEKNEASPASVTKIMTLLLVMEAINDRRIALEDEVLISDYAASMGGSQVFLEEGERFSVEELIKCTVIASANDAAVALAELVFGSESAFVAQMNARAGELGMVNTSFENVTGLDDTTKNHYTSAYDIALMSRELLKYELILKYSSMWQDTIRDGEFTLTNTNRLVRYYEGCNGLKTGSTDKAGFCISATAKRGDMQLIAVIMGAETRDERNTAARTLLDFGFSNFGIFKYDNKVYDNLKLTGGIKEEISAYSYGFSALVLKKDVKRVEVVYDLPNVFSAPIKKEETLGKIIFKVGDQVVSSCDVFSTEDVEKITYFEIFKNILRNIFIR